jgi:Fe2+ transport system protein FeoA
MTKEKNMESKQPRPLSTIKAGQTVILTGIEAGRGLKSRLVSMGLVPNTELTVVRSGRPGPFVIKVKNSRIAIGAGMADKIMVVVI